MTSPRKLIVVVPSLLGNRQKWEPLLSRLMQEPHLKAGTEAQWEFWAHDTRPFSFGAARSLSRRLAAFINEKVSTNQFEEIILVGHSMGALLVRDAYLLAAGAYERKIEVEQRSWSSKVTKFVLFASLSRGFDPDCRFLVRLMISAFNLVGLFGWTTASDMARGSDFITDLRLAWIRYFHQLAEAGHDPVLVQFLGTIDTIVRQQDCLDTEQFPRGQTIDVADATHDDLYQINKAADPNSRYQLIARVFESDYQPPATNRAPVISEPQRIAFVLHGIRASNTGWVEEICALIKKLYPDVVIEHAQYGYFSALNFFLPWVRRSRARWFQDVYSDWAAKSPNPDTKFYFIGHSNGTYMFGRGLKCVKMMRFDRAYLAGTVLPPSYPWRDRFADSQIAALRSDRSAFDWPVGLLCSALSFMRDIGPGGFSGFESAPPEVIEYQYYRGGHSKPLEDKRNLEAVVRYVLGGQDERPKGLIESPKVWFAFLSRALRYIGPFLIVLLLAGLILALVQFGPSLTPLGWAGTAVSFFVIVVVLVSF
jgi:pimeloyl-ACP methyl ester carboxylesterase